MSIARVDDFVANIARFLVKKEKRGVRHQEEYVDAVEMTGEIATKHIAGGFREFVRHYYK